jgi:WhiB family transcriptional regulator, redox-sensing transcriptional regulator
MKVRKLTAAAAVSLGTVEPPAPWARPSENGQGQDDGCLQTAGLAARRPAARPRHDLRCTDDPELFFAESPDEAEVAKALCRECPAQAACLAGALKRREPWGVWGGEVFLNGAIVPRKRARGRPRKTDAASRELGPQALVPGPERPDHLGVVSATAKSWPQSCHSLFREGSAAPERRCL